MRTMLLVLACVIGMVSPWAVAATNSPPQLIPHPRMGVIEKAMPRRAESLAIIIATKVLRDDDQATIVTTSQGSKTIAWTTTVGDLRRHAKGLAKEEPAIPTDPAPGTTITISSEQQFGTSIWRFTYEYTWMLNTETGKYEWSLTEAKWKFVRNVNQEQ